MGLIKKGYKIDKYNLVLDSAYARVTNVSVSASGRITALVKVQQNRDDTISSSSLEEHTYTFNATEILGNLFEQSYKYIKSLPEFSEWDDDIVK